MLLEDVGERAEMSLYLWAAQTALGVMYLEAQKMVHCDLAARSILLQNKKRVCNVTGGCGGKGRDESLSLGSSDSTGRDVP